jgi:hypothetical protein
MTMTQQHEQPIRQWSKRTSHPVLFGLWGPLLSAFGALALASGCGAGTDRAAGGANDGATGSGGVAPIDGIEVEPVGPYIHVLADLDYPVPAPSGGDHPPSPYLLNCGVYDGAVPDELVVHSLEHGAVWIALGPAATAADHQAAAELADQHGKVIVSDVPDLPDAIDLVAWSVRLRVDSMTDERAEQFVRRLIDAPSAPEAGAGCTGAVGDPPTPPTLPTG